MPSSRSHITGFDEADPAEGRIAFSAPLARALLGGSAGDLVDFAGEEEAIEIVEVAVERRLSPSWVCPNWLLGAPAMLNINAITVRLGGRTILDRATAAIPPGAASG